MLSATLVLGLISKIHVRNAVLSETGDTVDAGKLRAVARLGGTEYARIGEGFELERVRWKELKEEAEQLERQHSKA